MSDTSMILIAVVSFFFGGFYSGSETAFIALDRIRMRHLAARGNRRAQQVLSLVGRPEYLLSAVLVGTNLAVTACTAVVTALATRHYGDRGSAVATIALVPLFLLFNEIIPKGLFLQYANRAALATVDILRVLTVLLYPVVKSFSLFTNLLTRMLLRGERSGAPTVGMEELLYHVMDSREAGLIAPETSVLVERAIGLKELTAADVMKPIGHVRMIDADAPVDTYPAVFRREGFSRYPVFRGTPANVVGVMSVHDFITAGDREKLRAELSPPYCVALETPIVDMLVLMRERGRHMAMVKGDDGAVIGVTTMEDILERLMGAIADEFH